MPFLRLKLFNNIVIVLPNLERFHMREIRVKIKTFQFKWWQLINQFKYYETGKS